MMSTMLISQNLNSANVVTRMSVNIYLIHSDGNMKLQNSLAVFVQSIYKQTDCNDEIRSRNYNKDKKIKNQMTTLTSLGTNHFLISKYFITYFNIIMCFTTSTQEFICIEHLPGTNEDSI